MEYIKEDMKSCELSSPLELNGNFDYLLTFHTKNSLSVFYSEGRDRRQKYDMYSNRPAFDTFYIKVLLEMYHYCMELTTQYCLLDNFLSHETSFVKSIDILRWLFFLVIIHLQSD